MTIPAIVSLASGAARGVLANRARDEEERRRALAEERQRASDEAEVQAREDREAGSRGAFDILHRHDPDSYPAYIRGFDYSGHARELLTERRRRQAEEADAAEALKRFPGIPADLPAGEVLRAARSMTAQAVRPPSAAAVTRDIKAKATAQDAAVYRQRHPELASLSDAEIVRRGRALESRRPAARRPAGGGGAGGTVLQRLSQTRARLADVRRDIAAAERTTGASRSRLQNVLAAARRSFVEQAKYEADSTRAGRRLPGLRALRERLSAVRDSLATAATGGEPAAAGTVVERATRAATTAGERLDVTQAEFNELSRTYGAERARQHYRVVPTARSRTPAASRTFAAAQARAQALQAQGMSRDEIAAQLRAEGFNVEGGTPAPSGGAAATKTPAEWVAEVRADPAFRGATREAVIAEARRRAGAPATPRR